jgi:uncharacterized protein YgiM (DUF1202 family)
MAGHPHNCARAGLLAPLLALLLLTGSCATAPPPAAPVSHWVVPALTYLRDAPRYEGNVLGQLYRGEQVDRLDGSDEGGWWRVRAGRTGQTGYLPGDLLSQNPVQLTHLYVAVANVPLRECPQETCPTLQLLYAGDRVQELEENSQGWQRVLVGKGRTLGWLPPGVLAEKPVATKSPRPEKPYVYVAVARLKLRLNPELKAPVVKTLALNDQVERLEIGPDGWVRVRQPSSSAAGWVQGRYLKPLPVKAPPARKPKPPAPEKPEKKESPPEPTIM